MLSQHSKNQESKENKAIVNYLTQETCFWPDALSSFPDGRFCLSQTDTIKILDAKSQQSFNTHIPTQGITILSNDIVATAHKNNHSIQVWNLKKEKSILTLPLFANPECLTSNANYLICGLSTNSHDGVVSFWKITPEFKNIKPLAIAELATEYPVFAVSIFPDGNRLATGHHDGIICIWDIANLNHPKKLKIFKNVTDNQINSIVPMLTDEEHLAISDLSGNIVLLNLSTEKTVKIGSHAPLYTYLTLLPNQQLGFVSQNLMGIYDLALVKQHRETRKALENEILPIYFAPGVDQIILDYYSPHFFNKTKHTSKTDKQFSSGTRPRR